MKHSTEIAKLLSAGKVIRATWDAGGDQTLCSVLIDGEYADQWDVLAESIVEKLSLPNASENYHKGEGEIQLNDEGEIVLHFDSREHTYGKEETETVALLVEDPENLRSYLHKCEIELNGRWELDGKVEGYLFIETLYGDEVKIDDSRTGFYTQIVESLLQKIIQESIPMNDAEQELSMIWLQGKLTKEPIVYFQVNKSYDQVLYHTKEQVVLLT